MGVHELFDPWSNEPELTVPEPPVEATEFRIRVDLVHAVPPIWRRLELAGDLRLSAVHRLLQQAMGWEDYHLHAFRPPGAGRHFLTVHDLTEGDRGPAEADVRLDQPLRAEGDRLEYQYDFGDNWEHLLQVETVIRIEEGRPSRSWPTGCPWASIPTDSIRPRRMPRCAGSLMGWLSTRWRLG